MLLTEISLGLRPGKKTTLAGWTVVSYMSTRLIGQRPSCAIHSWDKSSSITELVHDQDMPSISRILNIPRSVHCRHFPEFCAAIAVVSHYSGCSALIYPWARQATTAFCSVSNTVRCSTWRRCSKGSPTRRIGSNIYPDEQPLSHSLARGRGRGRDLRCLRGIQSLSDSQAAGIVET